MYLPHFLYLMRMGFLGAQILVAPILFVFVFLFLISHIYWMNSVTYIYRYIIQFCQDRKKKLCNILAWLFPRLVLRNINPTAKIVADGTWYIVVMPRILIPGYSNQGPSYKLSACSAQRAELFYMHASTSSIEVILLCNVSLFFSFTQIR